MPQSSLSNLSLQLAVGHFTPPLLCSLGTPIAILSPCKGTHTTCARHADIWVTHAQSCSAHSQAQRHLVSQLSRHLKVLCPAAACTCRDDSITSFSDNSPSMEPALPPPAMFLYLLSSPTSSFSQKQAQQPCAGGTDDTHGAVRKARQEQFLNHPEQP